jgi:hypothetical protein
MTLPPLQSLEEYQAICKRSVEIQQENEDKRHHARTQVELRNMAREMGIDPKDLIDH